VLRSGQVVRQGARGFGRVWEGGRSARRMWGAGLCARVHAGRSVGRSCVRTGFNADRPLSNTESPRWRDRSAVGPTGAAGGGRDEQHWAAAGARNTPCARTPRHARRANDHHRTARRRANTYATANTTATAKPRRHEWRTAEPRPRGAAPPPLPAAVATPGVQGRARRGRAAPRRPCGAAGARLRRSRRTRRRSAGSPTPVERTTMRVSVA